MSVTKKNLVKLKNAAATSKPKFEDAKKLQEMVDAYFKECEGHVMVDETTNFPIFNSKTGLPVIVDVRPPTMSGLALYLGFSSRESLLNYAGRRDYVNIIVKAKSRVEKYFEERLFDKEGANGAKFALQNNFKGWQESAKVAAQEAANNAVRIVCDFPRPEKVKAVEATVPVAPEDEPPVLDDALINPAGDGKSPDEDDFVNV